MTQYAWLPAVCRGATFSRGLVSERPWTINGVSGLITVATSGHRMLIIDGEHGYPKAPPGAATPILRVIANSLNPATTSLPVDLDRFRSFIMDAAGDLPAPCDACDDCGFVSTESDEDDDTCPGCRGAWFEPRRVRVADALFNALKIAPLLPYLDGDRATWITRGTEVAPIALVAEGWRLLLMPLRPGVDDVREASAPVFDHTLRGRAAP